MKSFDEIVKNNRLAIRCKTMDGFDGLISMPLWTGTIICSIGAGWEHVSVAPTKKRITPSWDDMCMIKDIFWNADEAVIQIHPPKSEYVNNMPNCLHLWRCTYKEMILPPKILAGVNKGMSRAEFDRQIKEAYEIAGEVYE